jgi:hypothetical protein
MKKVHIAAAIVGIALAIAIFVFADGARRYYSGGFFAVVGIVNIIAALKGRSRPVT